MPRLHRLRWVRSHLGPQRPRHPPLPPVWRDRFGALPVTRAVWPQSVREHVREHQGWGCIGPQAGMPGECIGPAIELDHVRASGGLTLKSPSIATNAARLCARVHHPLKTREGRTWRPRLLSEIARLHGECAQCQRESIETWGVPLEGIAS